MYHDCDAASHVDEPCPGHLGPAGVAVVVFWSWQLLAASPLIQRLREDAHIATSPKLTTVAAAHNSIVIATKT